MNKFDEAFEKLKKDGKTSVEDIISWMKESKIIESTKEAEEEARKLFADVKDTQNVALDKFQQIVEAIAKEQKKTIEDFTRILTDQGPRLVNALAAGASALKDAFNKKKE